MKGKSSLKFYGIISIMALVLVLLGATFAYFTARAKSIDNAMDIASHFVNVAYNDGKDMQAADLIPSSYDVVIKSYNGVSDNGQCKDDNNRTVCSLYGFDVTNLGTIRQQLGAVIQSTYNRFFNLKYILFNVTDEEHVYIVSEGAIPNNYESSSQVTAKNYYVNIIGDEGQVAQYIDPNATEKYEVVIYLNEVGYDNNIEQGFSFRGTVTVSLTDEDHVKGTIAEAEDW